MSGRSLSNSASIRLSATSITGIVACSYLGLYTGYDKSTKKLRLSNLKDMFFLERGWDWTLVEANKALSLTALTTTLLSFLPQLKAQSRELQFQSAGMLWVHSIYSLYKFYGYSLKRLLDEKWIKQISLALGNMGLLTLSAGYLGYVSADAMVASVTLLGVGHFYTYEIDYKGVLQVRPFAYLPFPLAVAVLAYNAQSINTWTKSLMR